VPTERKLTGLKSAFGRELLAFIEDMRRPRWLADTQLSSLSAHLLCCFVPTERKLTGLKSAFGRELLAFIEDMRRPRWLADTQLSLA
jgi:hypothetical protein